MNYTVWKLFHKNIVIKWFRLGGACEGHLVDVLLKAEVKSRVDLDQSFVCPEEEKTQFFIVSTFPGRACLPPPGSVPRKAEPEGVKH